jgi:hypothetical protein
MSAILWAIIYTVATAPWHSCDTTEAERLKAEVARDDKLIDHMNGPDVWDRSKPMKARWYYISNGDKVWVYTQQPKADVNYQLSF